MVSSMLIKEPGCQTRSRLTEELAKVQENMCTYYMAIPEEKQIDTYSKMEWQMYFLENISGVNPVVMNYKIGRNKNQLATRPARYSFMWPDHFFHYYYSICGGRKTWSGHAWVRARVAMEEGLLIVWVSQSIGQSRSVVELSQLRFCENRVTNLM